MENFNIISGNIKHDEKYNFLIFVFMSDSIH